MLCLDFGYGNIQVCIMEMIRKNILSWLPLVVIWSLGSGLEQS